MYDKEFGKTLKEQWRSRICCLWRA